MEYQEALMVLQQKEALQQAANIYATMFFITITLLLATSWFFYSRHGLKRSTANNITKNVEVEKAPDFEPAPETVSESSPPLETFEETYDPTSDPVFVEFEEWFGHDPMQKGSSQTVLQNNFVQMPLPIQSCSIN